MVEETKAGMCAEDYESLLEQGQGDMPYGSFGGTFDESNVDEYGLSDDEDGLPPVAMMAGVVPPRLTSRLSLVRSFMMATSMLALVALSSSAAVLGVDSLVARRQQAGIGPVFDSPVMVSSTSSSTQSSNPAPDHAPSSVSWSGTDDSTAASGPDTLLPLRTDDANSAASVESSSNGGDDISGAGGESSGGVGGGVSSGIAGLAPGDVTTTGDDGDDGDAPAHSTIKDIVCGGKTMSLVCTVTAAVRPAASTYVRWFVLSSSMAGGPLMVPMPFTDNATIREVHLFRLRPSQRYMAELVEEVSSGSEQSYSIIDAMEFETSDTGIMEFDGGPLAKYTTGGFNFEVIVLAFAASDPMEFSGLVALDADGYVVWYFNTNGVTEIARGHVVAFDQFSDYGYSLALANYNSIVKVDTWGQLSAHHDFTRAPSGSSGNEYSLNMTYHECRVTADDLVIVSGIRTETLPEKHALSYEGMNLEVRQIYSDFVVQWDPTADAAGSRSAIKPLISVSNLLPWEEVLDSYQNTNESASAIILEVFSGAGAIQVYHTSSVSISEDSTMYIISLRNVNTILAVSITTAELVWTLSSSLRSDFEFSHETDKFFQPHDAHLYNGNHLLLMDDGNMRVECHDRERYDNVAEGCYSRAVYYNLDQDTGKVRLEWEFEWPTMVQKDESWADDALEAAANNDLYNYVGGSTVRESDDGIFLLAFTAVDKEPYTPYVYIFETNQTKSSSSGQSIELMSMMQVPASTWADAAVSGSYRVNPYSSIHGERSTAFMSIDYAPTDSSVSSKTPPPAAGGVTVDDAEEGDRR